MLDSSILVSIFVTSLTSSLCPVSHLTSFSSLHISVKCWYMLRSTLHIVIHIYYKPIKTIPYFLNHGHLFSKDSSFWFHIYFGWSSKSHPNATYQTLSPRILFSLMVCIKFKNEKPAKQLVCIKQGDLVAFLR